MERMRRRAACRISIAIPRASISESRNTEKNRFGMCGLFSVAPRAFRYFARSRSISSILPGLYPSVTSISDSYLASGHCLLCNARASRRPYTGFSPQMMWRSSSVRRSAARSPISKACDTQRLRHRLCEGVADRRTHGVADLSNDLVCGALEAPVFRKALKHGAVLHGQTEVSVLGGKPRCVAATPLHSVRPDMQPLPYRLAGPAVQDAGGFSRPREAGTKRRREAVETDVRQPQRRAGAEGSVSGRKQIVAPAVRRRRDAKGAGGFPGPEANEEDSLAHLGNAEIRCQEPELDDVVSGRQRLENPVADVAVELRVQQAGDVLGHESARPELQYCGRERGPHVAAVFAALSFSSGGERLAGRAAVHDVHTAFERGPVNLADISRQSAEHAPLGTASPQRRAADVQDVEAGDMLESGALEGQIEPAPAGEQRQRTQAMRLLLRHQARGVEVRNIDVPRVRYELPTACRLLALP